LSEFELKNGREITEWVLVRGGDLAVAAEKKWPDKPEMYCTALYFLSAHLEGAASSLVPLKPDSQAVLDSFRAKVFAEAQKWKKAQK
jgi:hypothetical protein